MSVDSRESIKGLRPDDETATGPAARPRAEVVDLMEAQRRSLEEGAKRSPSAPPGAEAPARAGAPAGPSLSQATVLLNTPGVVTTPGVEVELAAEARERRDGPTTSP